MASVNDLTRADRGEMLNIDVLGGVCIRDKSARHAVPGAKLRTILALLAMADGQLVHRDELLEELQLKNVNAIHAHITRLRKWLHATCEAAEVLITDGDGYRLNVSTAQVDALRFIDLVESVWKSNPSSPTKQIEILEEAFSLWQGSSLFTDVNDGERVRSASSMLQQLRFEAQETLVAALAEAEDYRRVIVCASRFLSENPLRECLWEQLMNALYAEGRYAEVVDSYHRVSRILADQLGIDPSPRLEAQFNRVLGGRVLTETA